MTDIPIKNIFVGFPEGKDEFGDEAEDWLETFFEPVNMQEENFINRQNYYIYGMRGTGKTSYLRWFGGRRAASGDFVKYILFKSEITEPVRQIISVSQGYEKVEQEGGK